LIQFTIFRRSGKQYTKLKSMRPPARRSPAGQARYRNLEHLSVDRVQVERSDSDWVAYEVREQKFVGHGGPLCLNELVSIFRKYWDTAETE
jgi:hypothetical protein